MRRHHRELSHHRGRRSRTEHPRAPNHHLDAPIARRRVSAVLARDDGCTIDGCTSTYRLEAHHITCPGGPCDPKAGITQPRTSPPSAGTTTTSPSTAEACASTPNHHPEDVDYCHQGQEPAATSRPNPTPTPSPSSKPYTATGQTRPTLTRSPSCARWHSSPGGWSIIAPPGPCRPHAPHDGRSPRSRILRTNVT